VRVIKNGKRGVDTALAVFLGWSATPRGGWSRCVTSEFVLVDEGGSPRTGLYRGRRLHKGHPIPQAAEARLNNRRKARRPVIPMPSRASVAGSGTEVEEKAWVMMESDSPLLPPSRKMSF